MATNPSICIFLKNYYLMKFMNEGIIDPFEL